MPDNAGNSIRRSRVQVVSTLTASFFPISPVTSVSWFPAMWKQTTVELLIEYARTHSDTRIQRHVERGVRRVTNLNTQRLIDLVGTLDPAWRTELEKFIVDEYKDALDGIVALRNNVAHGRYVGVTMLRANEYYMRVKKIIDRVADLVIP